MARKVGKRKIFDIILFYILFIFGAYIIFYKNRVMGILLIIGSLIPIHQEVLRYIDLFREEKSNTPYKNREGVRDDKKLIILDDKTGNEKKELFISYNHKDEVFVNKLVKDLKEIGADVWIDKSEIKLGDSLIQKISDGIETTDYLAVVLSPNSISSSWVQKEVNIAMTNEINGKRVKVLPLLYKPCKLPTFLSDKFYADFTDDSKYKGSLKLILNRLGIKINPKSKSKGRK